MDLPVTKRVQCSKLVRIGPTGSARVLSQIRMQMETARLSTFRGWIPNWIGAPTPVDFATAGFVYQGVTDHVQCSTCCLVLTDWVAGHDPRTEHHRHNPRCDFLREPGPRVICPSPTLSSDPPSEDRPVPTGSQLGDVTLCKICFSQEMSVLFRPCGHLLTCRSCSTQLVHCPVCRQPIRETCRAYISFQ